MVLEPLILYCSQMIAVDQRFVALAVCLFCTMAKLLHCPWSHASTFLCSFLTHLGVFSFQVENYCLQGCICHTEPEVEVVLMRALTRVDIVNYIGTPAQLYVVEQLLARAPRIRLLRIITSEAEDPSLGTIESLCPAGCLLELVRR